MRHRLIRKLLAAAASVALGLGCTSCAGMYLGVGTNVGVPIPGGSVNVSLGTTVPIAPPVDYGMTGWHPYYGSSWGWHRPWRPAPPYTPGFGF